MRTDPGVSWPTNEANTAPTGAPTVSGTPQAGETLTADTSGIADSDGTARASFRHQWIAHDGTKDADIDGATGSSYTLTDTEVGKSIKVKVSFSDDKGTNETLTSAATRAVTAAPAAPTLSATFPSSRFASAKHTGADDVPQVIVEFSEAVASFTKSTPSVRLTGGTIANVQSHTETGLEHAYILWLTPTGNADVTFTLLADAECDAGAICTTAGTELTGVPATRTIPGPGETAAKLAVGDATAAENDARIDFVVTLDPASDETVTVDYATSNGTAAAGSDYTAKSGTLTFNANETSKTVAVGIVDDDVVESDETLTLTLSNAAGAEMEDEKATGTIADDDEAATSTLTAAFENVPAEHDGETSFRLNVAFSAEVAIGYAAMRDHAFTVEQGDVTQARRVDGRSDRWEITVEPEGNEDVTVTLPANRACTTTGAVCSKDDEPVRLSNSPTATVVGPSETVAPATPAVSIAGGTGAEGDDGAITFTVTLDAAAAATVTVDYITSDGSARAGDDYTSTSGTLSFSAGTTSRRLSVPIEDDIVNEADETFTVTLSNPSGAVLGTSSATGTIENRYVAPLTARFENMPSEHDGSEFTFDLHFSDNPELPYRRLRDRSFTLVQADVIRARRENPQATDKNRSWTITVKPFGNAQIGITLPAAVSCTDDKSICTGDGRKLSHSTAATIAGPPSISVADATVTEAAGAVLAFTVSLSRSSGSNVTLEYATSDGTATAGADYTAASGKLTIGAGSTESNIEVTVLDDSHDDDGETMTLTLSNASNGTLNDRTATGTIENRDAMPAALAIRFGRTAAGHVIEQIEQRINAPRKPGFDGRVAGRRIDRRSAGATAVQLLRRLNGASPGSRRRHDPRTAGYALGNAAPLEHDLQAAGVRGRARVDRGGPRHTDRGLIGGSTFTMNRATKDGGAWSVWSGSADSRFTGREGKMALDGEVGTTTMGADYSTRSMVTGIALGHSRGLGHYRGADTGEMASAMTGVYPWVGYRPSERVTIWTTAGYGRGNLLLRPGRDAPMKTGLAMAAAAAGARGRIAGGSGRGELAFKSEALWVRTQTDAIDDAGGTVQATNGTATRLRTAIEARGTVRSGRRATLTPSIEIGVREDAGDADNGRGIDVGGGVRLTDGVSGLSVEVAAQRLLVHEAEGYSENTFSMGINYDPTPSSALGLRARAAPAWGSDRHGGAEAMWGRTSLSELGRSRMPASGGRIDSELSYGLPIGQRLVGTPRIGVRSAADGRDYRIGYAIEMLHQERLRLDVGIDVEHRAFDGARRNEGTPDSDRRVLASATIEW